ncbi:hypothetical protein AVEN_206424-1 [Araneus ventricosus]|uniref:Uncharacterized protein n=1 Tax=Araneus ventricosus TaxID=182803 RepID=A0A4Y2IMA4_ARAVE|nr:hypothetical protein AVEN_206424-1 [Araneus ventricosus]
MSPLTLEKSRASKGSVSKVSLDRRRQERMCSGDALAIPHFAQTGKTLLPWLKEQLLRLGSVYEVLGFHFWTDSAEDAYARIFGESARLPEKHGTFENV